ncbi:MAG TPA: SDR family NAD(P)-dependent oxidoreductase, partial [Solirubrobacterales bacterium]|nr:SDR family NAD(P)-dependent oxidoreductase [Solirubrobacterales bacterium]
MRLKNRVALVTGGGSGIGEAICTRFDAEGASVAVLDIREEAAKLTAGLLANEALPIKADVTDSAEVNRAVEQVVDHYGKIDVLVNNAGIAGGEESVRNAERFVQRLREAEAGEVRTPLEAT